MLAALRLSTKMSKFEEIFWMVLKSLIMPEFSVDLHWKCVMSKMEQIRTFQMNFTQAGFLSQLADLSNLTEFSCM